MHSVQSLLPTILLFLYFASMPSFSSYYRYASCAPSLYTCGSKNLSINYPFRVDSRPDFCGHPGYYISCSKINSAMMITINDKGYQVIDVDYLNHLITVVDQLFLAQPCPRPYENTSIASSLYSCSDRDRNVALFVNCSALAPTPADVVELVCAVGATGKHWYYKVKNDMNGELVGRCSSTVMVPVHQPAADELASGKLSFGEAVSKGFSVKWTAGEGWCSDCVNSGGRCGFEGLTTIDRTCYCLYGAAVGTCSSKAKATKPAALVQTPSVGDCEIRSCGNGVDITFPFWLSGQQKSYCGYPAFEVSCKNRRTVLEIIDHSFYLHHIFYNNRSVVLTTVEFENDQCPLPYTSFGTNSSIYPFAMSPQNTDIYFLLNCSHDLTGYESINCSQTHGAYFAGTKRPENTSCDLYFVPVLEYSEAGNHDYKRALRSGWLMTWTMPDCDGCMGSGGRCGYNESTASILCICHDQIYPDICRRGAHKKTKVVVIGTLAAACVLVLSCTCLILYGHKKKKGFCLSSKLLSQNASFKLSKRDPGLASAHIQTHIFSHDELHKATDCFNASNELGGGGFGTVYKGKLQDGRTIAVKRLYENNSRRLEQFMNEIDILSRLQHPNLVNLYGCTSPISQSLLLVYEFVPNGTLADHLHGLRANERILTWAMRLNIAIETAHALAYLHSINPPIIHRDVKTCNILLDSSFHVKVADFGLSRLIPIDAMHVSTAPQGTPGYLDPEYHRCYQLTDKSDVYSFGVVLLELISSKPAIDMSRNRSDITLANMAITRIQNGELEQLVDASLGYISDQTIRKMMTMVAELAFRCLQFDGDMRPPIKEVLEVLKAVEGEWHKVDNERIDSTQNQADAELLKNTPPFSPDSVMKKWASRNSTPNTTE